MEQGTANLPNIKNFALFSLYKLYQFQGWFSQCTFSLIPNTCTNLRVQIIASQNQKSNLLDLNRGLQSSLFRKTA